MKFQAQGGGDTPESVNQALHESVTKIKWNKSKKVLKLVFLVGDAPPHMDYQDDVKYPEICKLAAKSNIILNTVQCGNMASTTPVWEEIAKLAEGDYVAIAQSGGVAAISTPVDAEIAKLNRELGITVVAYGDSDKRRVVRGKIALAAEAKEEVAADRLSVLSFKSKAVAADSDGTAGVGYASSYVDGGGDLVDELASGRVAFDEVQAEKLPENVRKMSAKERKAHLEEQVAKRKELQKKLDELLTKRRDFVTEEKKRLAKSGKKDGFDEKVSEIISKRRR